MTDASQVHERLNADLEFFCAAAPVYIKDKVGGLVKFVMNKAQRYIHYRIEAQRKKRGWVRIILLKGRQQGGSTYTAVRYYHRARSVPGTSVFILSHDGKTTDKLFKMVERIHENTHPAVRPEVGASNRYQLDFIKLGSDYAVGTAGNENVGRGGTAQLFHGSEVAYWENAQAIQDGALESIALLPGTEIILESTANGPVGLFHDKAMAALKGEGDYEAFQATGVGLFRADAIMAARKSTITDESAAVVAGVDVAGDSEDSDRTVITIRRGRFLGAGAHQLGRIVSRAELEVLLEFHR